MTMGPRVRQSICELVLQVIFRDLFIRDDIKLRSDFVSGPGRAGLAFDETNRDNPRGTRMLGRKACPREVDRLLSVGDLVELISGKTSVARY